MSAEVWTRRSVLALGGLAAAPALANPDADSRLAAVFAASDEASLRRNPLNALSRGDRRFADRFGDYLSDAYFDAERTSAQFDLMALSRIDRGALSSEMQVAYDVFAWQRTIDLRATDPELLAVSKVRPIEHLKGLHVLMVEISAGDSWAPFDTVADYDANLGRLDGFVAYLAAVEARLRQGVVHGITQPRLVMEKVAGQLEAVGRAPVRESPFYRPIAQLSPAIPEADRRRLASRYARFIGDVLAPAHLRLADYIRAEYLPRARSAPGLCAMPGGEALYRHLVETHTTIRVPPGEIHTLGLAEVARIEAEMRRVMAEVGATGELAAFASTMRTDPRFKPASAEQIRSRYVKIETRVRERLAGLFARVPKAPLEIRPFPAFRAPTAPNASYSQGPPDGSRPGVFYFNAHDLESRVNFDAESLFLHEAIPGHHLQNNLAQENERLPAFLRFDGPAAFGEGWGLYAESLGSELGLYQDPYQRYGRLTNEMFRATRLVVDTGLHAMNWSREQALDYMIRHTAYGEAMLAGEVDRYIAYPGQALAYKVGELTLLRLRDRARGVLGSRFDLRAFHGQVLDTGRLPMAVLEAKIDRWIGQGGRA